MENPRPEKVAIVDEVRGRFSEADAALLTEYRGINVEDMAELRGAILEAGGEYKIYKNTLVRLAVRELQLEIEQFLSGPTAICFVPPGTDGRPGDPAAVAKALKEFSKKNEALVFKGGLLGDKVLSADEALSLADIPPREVLLSEFAGAMESMLQDFAGLLDAKLREFSYALDEFLDKGGPQGGAGEAPAATDEPPTETSAAETPAEETPAEGGAETTTDAGDDTPATDDSQTEEG